MIPPPAHTRSERRRAAVDWFLHHPATEVGIVVLIVAAVVAVVAESIAPQGSMQRTVLEGVSTVIGLVFAVELTLRFWVAPSKRGFFRRYWIDILAVIPIARPLRLLRVLMLLRLFRAGAMLNRRLALYGGMVRSTFNELMALTTASLTIVLVGAVVLQAFPGAVEYQGQGFLAEVEAALWYATLTLIGGEPIGGLPQTEVGRAVSLALMVGGLTVFGIFIGAVSASVSTVLSDRLKSGDMELDEFQDHIIVCGWNPAGPTMLGELFSGSGPHPPVVVVTETPLDEEALGAGRPLSALVLRHTGDFTRVDVLDAVGVRRARAAFLLTDSQTARSDQDRDARTILAAHTIERMNPEIYCCAELINEANSAALDLTQVEEVVVRDWYAGVIIGSMGRNRGLSSVLNDILSSAEGSAFHQITVPPHWDGRTVGEAHQTLKQEHDAILVSWERGGRVKSSGAKRAVEVNPPVTRQLQTGDRLVIIGPGRVRL